MGVVIEEVEDEREDEQKAEVGEQVEKEEPLKVEDKPEVQMMDMNVKLQFGWTVHQLGEYLTKHIVVQVAKDGSSSIASLKQQISEMEGIPVKEIYLEWMDKPLGRQHADDEKDEEKCTMADYNIITWIEKFPDWKVLCKLQPPGPVDPYVAIKRTVAVQMGKDPDEEERKARKDGSLYHIDTWDEHKKRYGIK